jgi:hypothetical protein
VSRATEQRVSEGRAGLAHTVRVRPLQIAKAVGAAVTFAATATGLIFGLWPALKPVEPPATKGATLTAVTLDRATRGQYLDRSFLGRSGYGPAQLERPGELISFDFKIKGYLDKRLPLRWQLVDARTGDQVAESRDLFIIPVANDDQNSWSIWVPLPRGRSRRFFVEIELLDERAAVPLGRVRSDRFGGT